MFVSKIEHSSNIRYFIELDRILKKIENLYLIEKFPISTPNKLHVTRSPVSATICLPTKFAAVLKKSSNGVHENGLKKIFLAKVAILGYLLKTTR